MRSAADAYRPSITAPDGRIYRGIWPQNVRTPHEGPYIVDLAKRVGGIPEVTLPCGRADVCTNTDVFEVEPVSSWRSGARQAFSYSGMTGLAANLALFGGCRLPRHLPADSRQDARPHAVAVQPRTLGPSAVTARSDPRDPWRSARANPVGTVQGHDPARRDP